MSLARVQRLVARRLQHLAKVRDIAADGFETTRGYKDVLRRMEVVRYVASRLGTPVNTELCTTVRAAGKLLGWLPASLNGAAMFRGVKAK